MRLQGNATVVNDHRADVAWEAVTLQSRSDYLSADPPGKQVWSQQPPSSADRFLDQSDSEVGRENFRLIRTQVHSVDWLYLRQGGHVRASLTYGAKGRAEVSWLVP